MSGSKKFRTRLAARDLRLGIACALGFAAMPAFAHPHVTVVARAAFVMDATGKITGIRHKWEFDEAYSSFAVTGMKAGPDGKVGAGELKDLAKLNVESLNDFAYFTVLKQGSKALGFNAPLDGYFLEHDGKALTLNFVLPLKSPVSPTSTTSLRVDDETFFVAFSFAESDPVTIEGKSPCKVEIKRPAKKADQGVARLGEDFFNNLKTGFTDDFATSVKLSCP